MVHVPGTELSGAGTSKKVVVWALELAGEWALVLFHMTSLRDVPHDSAGSLD